MPIRRYKPEEVVTLLRQIEVAIANGKTTPQACKDAMRSASLSICVGHPCTRSARRQAGLKRRRYSRSQRPIDLFNPLVTAMPM